MNIIFFGNGNFALKSLQKLVNNNSHKILAVVTNKSKKKGRGLEFVKTSIASYSYENSLNVIEIDNICSDVFINELKRYNADIFIVIEYKILPYEIFNIPKYGTMNIHASLLPRYRGASPIQTALINGDKELGVTSFILNKSIDKGDIINQLSYNFDDTVTYSDAYNKLSILGAELMIDSLKSVKEGRKLIKQNNKNLLHAPKFKKSDYRLDITDDARNIHNRIRGLTSSKPPRPYLFIKNKKVNFFETYYVYQDNRNEIGEHYSFDNKLYICCGKGFLTINQLKVENKNIIRAKDFSNISYLKNEKFY